MMDDIERYQVQKSLSNGRSHHTWKDVPLSIRAREYSEVWKGIGASSATFKEATCHLAEMFCSGGLDHHQCPTFFMGQDSRWLAQIKAQVK